MHLREMLSSHPRIHGGLPEPVAVCIEACFHCAGICNSCADACLAEDMVKELTQCIRLDLDCADMCFTAGTMMLRHTGQNGETMQRMIDACAVACRVCAEECERHAAMHMHCKHCAEACRECERACMDAARSLH